MPRTKPEDRTEVEQGDAEVHVQVNGTKPRRSGSVPDDDAVTMKRAETKDPTAAKEANDAESAAPKDVDSAKAHKAKHPKAAPAPKADEHPKSVEHAKAVEHDPKAVEHPKAVEGHATVHGAVAHNETVELHGATGKHEDAAEEPADLFFEQQRELLTEERNNYTRQAAELKAQAEALALEHEPGDVQFDEEGGEGGTANVDRELDLHLSAQAVAAVEEIDAALAKISAGTYGLCESCGNPVPRARLEALPHARLCVTCKSGGLTARRQ